MTVELVELRALTSDQRRDLYGDELDPFEMAAAGLRWRDKDDFVALRDPHGHVVAVAGLVRAELEAVSGPLAVVGLGHVMVARPHRGRGHSRTIVEAAMRRAETFGPDFAMLFCRPDRVGLYERLRFVEVGAPVTVDQPDGAIEMPIRAMWRALRDGADWPAGPLRLRGLPF